MTSAYEISADVARLQVDRVHRWISEESYWGLGRGLDTMVRAVGASVCAGAYAPDGTQVAFARVVTDRATFGWLCDVFVEEAHRGHGLGKDVVRAVLDHPDMADVRQIILATADAHGLYRAFGFDDLPPDRYLRLQR